MLTAEQIDEFRINGFLLAPGLLDQAEADRLLAALGGPAGTAAPWTALGEDLPSLVARNDRMADSASDLLGGEAYHWVSMAWGHRTRPWRQDFSDWYAGNILFPHMLRCFIAAGAPPETAGLHLIPGSHRMGRLEHRPAAGHPGLTEADPARVAAAQARLGLFRAEAEPGDALFIHCNTLCAGSAADGTAPWGLACCYNRYDNGPYAPADGSPAYAPIQKVTGNALLEPSASEAS